MAEGFTTHYSRLMNYKRQIRKKIELRTIIQSKHRDYTENFLMPQLNQAINRMRNEKNPGPDSIHMELIKHGRKGARLYFFSFFKHVENKQQ
jgi:hypothetical protein